MGGRKKRKVENYWFSFNLPASSQRLLNPLSLLQTKAQGASASPKMMLEDQLQQGDSAVFMFPILLAHPTPTLRLAV